ncbi:MerR family transcriptional regulator [Amycolatopsis sp. cmx-4-83]|uniref:MerR family transcriptional regulator n=1 Tax=Amycolatopsis sp. cmx-4-83 TaxID=2790940 RepID=UPI003977F9B0
MRIGELAERTGTARRLLRYYEEQGLIIASRGANGYRDYDEPTVDRVIQVRGLLDAGLPTRIIKQILPCLDKPRAIYFPDATPEMLATLEAERDRMARRAECLLRNRDAISGYLDAVREYNRA